jgi:tetratricopeptide (TPR) repeat protein
MQLGRSEQALALLTARERALPDDYNPPHYLARVYRDLKRFDEGLAAVERALEKLEGPRRAGILGVKVDLLSGLDRRDEARLALEAQLAAYRALPEGQKQPSREASVAARLASFP